MVDLNGKCSASKESFIRDNKSTKKGRVLSHFIIIWQQVSIPKMYTTLDESVMVWWCIYHNYWQTEAYQSESLQWLLKPELMLFQVWPRIPQEPRSLTESLAAYCMMTLFWIEAGATRTLPLLRGCRPLPRKYARASSYAHAWAFRL